MSKYRQPLRGGGVTEKEAEKWAGVGWNWKELAETVFFFETGEMPACFPTVESDRE